MSTSSRVASEFAFNHDGDYELVVPGVNVPTTQTLREKFAFLTQCGAHTKLGRAMQLTQVLLVALIAAGGIIVQVYTDADMADHRAIKATKLTEANSLTVQLYDVMILLANEMEPFYQYNRGPYEVFIQQAEIVMRKVDTKLLWIQYWPSDFSAVPEAGRANISSSLALRNALRLFRDMRKAPNGTSETDVIDFYSTIIDNIGSLVRGSTLSVERFPGWKEFFTSFFLFEMLINFKRYSIVGQKLVSENRTVTLDEPVYRSIIQLYNRYSEFMKIVTVTSDIGEAKIKNLSDQESIKSVERMQAYVMEQDFVTPPINVWIEAMNDHEANILWIIDSMRGDTAKSMMFFATAWPADDMFSIAFFIISTTIVVTAIFIHVFGTWGIQAQVVQSYKNLNQLTQALDLIYDSIPKSFIGSVKAGDLSPPRHCTDTCIMVMDVRNMLTLMQEMDSNDFADLLEAFYLEIEARLKKYSCFKIGVLGDCMALASGVGEYHLTDHVGEMVYFALELLDLTEQSYKSNESTETLRLRIGIHVGSCYARIFTGLKIPQVGIFGPAMQAACLIHATGLGLKLHVSAAVFARLANVDEISFIERGILNISGLKTYWANWSSGTSYIGEDDRQSVY